VHSGALTGRAATRLAAEQRAIRREALVYRWSESVLSRRERADLQRDLRFASRDIWRQKHDAQRRF